MVSTSDRAPTPTISFGGDGSPLYFLHANGFPPRCYGPLLTRLARRYRVNAMVQRPLWDGSDPQEITDWIPLSADLLKFINEQHASPAIVVGHSLGGIVALRAGLSHPDKFRALVLIDPVLFPPRRILHWRLQRALGGLKRHPLIIGARNRRQSFDDLDRLFNAYRQRENFRYMDNDALWAYISSITRPAADGTYGLSFSVAWETQIYYTGIWPDLDIWRGLPKLRVPTLILRGEETDTFWESTARRVERANSAIQVRTVNQATHLVPLERPLETASMIDEFVSKVTTPRNQSLPNS